MRWKWRYGSSLVLLTVYLLANKGERSLSLLARPSVVFLRELRRAGGLRTLSREVEARMDGQKPEAVEEQSRTENPEDVAVLYSWANLQGARYRDFSGARRESRALMRHRAAQEAKDAESRAQAEAEAAAAVAERAAREAEEIARLHEKAARRAAEARHRRDLEMEEGARALAMRQATELSRKAASERVQAARSAEAAAAASAAERREAREITDARASAERQALRYAEAEMRGAQAGRTATGLEASRRVDGSVSTSARAGAADSGESFLNIDNA